MPSLAVKYRPKTFDEICEQSVVVDILKPICKSDTIDCRNFLFIGSAGIGKTTTCRVMARELNGSFSNIIEIDAASNNGVENMRKHVEQKKKYTVRTK